MLGFQRRDGMAEDTQRKPRKKRRLRKKLDDKEKQAKLERRLARFKPQLTSLLRESGLGVNGVNVTSHGSTATVTFQVRLPDRDESFKTLPTPEGSTDELDPEETIE